MSITLGEKLRQARETRGISISEVAEQTRISPLYIKSIEEDDYRTLPGGIFNKGFVKSYARHVGVDEQEALQDYAALMNTTNVSIEDEPKTYRPQVLTDDASSSGLRTVVFAVVILGLMVVGILALMNYLQNRPNDVAVANTNGAVNGNSVNSAAIVNANVSNASTAAAPSMNDLRVEVKTTGADVYVNSLADGRKASTLMTADKPLNFTPKESLKIGFAKTLASNVQLSVNGKQIALPTAPQNPKRSVIEVEITKDNLATVWQNGKVSFDASPASQ